MSSSKNTRPAEGNSESPQRVFFGGDNHANIVCPACNYIKTVDVSRYRSIHKPVKVRCKCQKEFYVLFEHRRYYRKETELKGQFWQQRGQPSSMVVKSLSMGGVGFATSHSHRLKVDDTVQIAFHLDDPQRSRIEAAAVVRRVEDRNVGAEFIDLMPDTRKRLGFYLMP